MGYSTVVVLYNDQSLQWIGNPHLGQAISRASIEAMKTKPGPDANLAGYGRVVACCHADDQMLGVFDHYQFKPMAITQWIQGQSDIDMQLSLLKEAANKLGYKLVKKTS